MALAHLGQWLGGIPSLVQWYSYTGVFGGSLWIWVANLLGLQAWNTYQHTGRITPIQGIKGALWLLLPMGVSAWMYLTYQEKGATVDVVVIQPNYEPHYEKFSLPESVQIQQCIALAKPLMDEKVDYLLLPETAYGFVEENDVWNNAESMALLDAFGGFPQLQIVTGLNAYHDLLPDEPTTKATRIRTRAGREIRYEVMNLAAQLPMNREQAVQTYRKSKLVPGPEHFPFQRMLFFMADVVNELGGTTEGLGTQPERTAFTSRVGRVAPVVCYESVFGDYFAGYVRGKDKAQAAFIMTNDGWWDNTAGHRQHLYYASLRAIETRRSIARSANTGISCFLNQRGDILQPTRYNEPIAIRGTLHLNDDLTFYVRWGDMIARIALLASIIFILNTFVKSIMARHES
ncbi:MAG: apolipoprotein N-acyltransferase [Saprospiraceae bacterium]